MTAATIETSPLWSTIKRIRGEGGSLVKEKLTATLHLPKEDLPILKVVSLDMIEDYVHKVGQLINIQFQVGLGDYVRRMYPERDLMEMTVKAEPVDNVAMAALPNLSIDAVRYKVIFKPDDNPPGAATGLENFSTTELNIQSIVTLNMQLIPVQTEVQRMITLPDYTFNQIKLTDFLRAVMLSHASNMVVDGKDSCDGVDIVKVDNADTIKTLLMPNGIHLSAIPTWLQVKGPGLYTGAVGTFFKRYRDRWLWFVYPLYRYHTDPKRPKAVFYAVPKERLQGETATYTTSGDLVEALVTGDKRYTDSAEVDTLNEGSGFRLTDARAIINQPVNIDDDGAVTTTADENNHDVVLSERRDKAQYAPIASRGVSVNAFHEYSKVAARGAGRVDFIWTNGSIDLLYPGMPCEYVYLDKNIVKTVKGTLLMAHAVYALQGQIHASTVHHRNVMITMATETIKIEVSSADLDVKAAEINL